MSEARDRLETAGADAWCDAEDASLDRAPGAYVGPRPTGAYLDAMLAHPDDLIAVVIETLTCETCEGTGNKPGRETTGYRDECPECQGSGLDPVKVQAVLRQFADAGALTEETRGFDVPRTTDGTDEALPPLESRVVGPWVPLGAPE